MRTRAAAAALEALEGRRLLCGQALANAVGMSFWGNELGAHDGQTAAGQTAVMQPDSPVAPPSFASVAADTGPNGMPLLHSLPGAPTAVFLDFDGYVTSTNNTLPYDTDGNPQTFNATEQADIREAWRHVASYFAVFNANVTTVQPTIPFSWSMITNSNTGVGYSHMVFNGNSPGSYNPSGDARTRRSGIAHEIGHNFGLSHQSDFDQWGEKINEYSSGYDSLHGPIMGVDYAQNIHKWFIGHPSESPSTIQDDVAVIAAKVRGFGGGDGMRADDHPNAVSAPRVLTGTGGTYTTSGIIERLSDADAFSFVSTGGQVVIDLVPPSPSMLDAKLELYTSGGVLVAAADGSNNDQHLNLPSLAAGTYVAVVKSHGDYGDLGPYDLKVVASATGTGTTPTYNALPSPGNVVLGRNADTGVTVAWDAVSGATGYAVDRSSDGVTWSQFRTTTAGEATTVTDTATAGGRRYFYRVAALDGVTRSVPSAVSHLVTRPAAVSSLTVTSWRPNSLVLNWRDVAGDTGYRIERQTDAATNTWTTIGTVPANVPSYTVTGLSAGIAYKFRVSANSVGGEAVPVEASGTTRLPAVSGLMFTTREPNRLAFKWNAQAGVTYRVERSLNGRDYNTVATLTTTSYEDTAVQPVKEYFYRVVATTPGAQGLLGDPLFCATPAAAAQALPAPWTDRDIGGVGGAGATGYSAGTFTVLSSGNDIWEDADAFHYTYQPLVGDGEIAARVASQEYTSGWAKAGVMIRETLLPGSRHAMMIVTPDNGTAFQNRTYTNGSTENDNTPGGYAPYWVRLVRQGTTLIGYRSANGTSWTEQARVTIPMSASAYVGLAVVPGDNANLANVSFTNVSVSNRAPTVAVAAAAAPAVVTSRTTTLSVLGADDHGESNLRYTWSAVQVPAGASSPQFSVEGVNAARTVTATFSRAGAYVLRVTAVDSAGLTVTSTVNVQVMSSAAALVVGPADPVVATGGMLQLSANVLDQFAVPMVPAPAFLWSASGGSVDDAGIYNAPSRPGTYTLAAEAVGLTRFLSVRVVASDVTAPQVLSAASSKRHGRRGAFDVPLRLDAAATAPAVEPRHGGATALKFAFDEPLAAADGVLDAGEFALAGATFGSASFEAVASGLYQLTLHLTGVSNGGVVTVTLNDLVDAAGNALAGDRDVSVRSLFGDVNGSGRVDAVDALEVRAGLYSAPGAWNYLLDLDLSGAITVIDQLHARRNSARLLAGGV